MKHFSHNSVKNALRGVVDSERLFKRVWDSSQQAKSVRQAIARTGSCTAHFIREEVLKQIVWNRIFDVTALFFDDIMAFHDMMYQQRSAETEKEMKRRKRWTGNGYRKWILFSTLWGKSIFFLPRNRNSKAQRNSKRRYSPCSRGLYRLI